MMVISHQKDNMIQFTKLIGIGHLRDVVLNLNSDISKKPGVAHLVKYFGTSNSASVWKLRLLSTITAALIGLQIR